MASGDYPFKSGLFETANKLKEEHASSGPYQHAVIHGLFDDQFLKTTRKEITEQLHFTEKETDIYKISQTGDLTNLGGLPEEEKSRLSNLLKLRDAIYSSRFRQFIRDITGCGPLSGIKTDMSCAEYGRGSYLLNHDDVIGTRRISFILYLVNDVPAWKPEWGGALELYPVIEPDINNPDRPNIPEAKPTLSIPPAFNQFAFFQVQPGHSFHSVEEVVAHGDGIRGGVGSRVSLSGWFHKPIEGEEGYEGDEGFKPKSSLQQLYASTLSAATPYTKEMELPLPTTIPQNIAKELSLLNPAYLNTKTLTKLREDFVESSQLLLSNFLKPDVAKELENLIRAEDTLGEKKRRGVNVGESRTDLIPSMDLGEGNGWQVVGPPHIQRFLALEETTSINRLGQLLNQIHVMIRSDAFRSLIAALTATLPLAHTTHVRRFRPGLDFTLARGEPAEGGDARLDLTLSLTPKPTRLMDRKLWSEGEIGAWELWLASEEGGDEAVYGAGAQGGEEEDEGPLLAIEPEWNNLCLVLRDPGVLKFVKYMSSRAPGSRWDIAGEWEIAMVEQEEDSAMEE